MLSGGGEENGAAFKAMLGGGGGSQARRRHEPYSTLRERGSVAGRRRPGAPERVLRRQFATRRDERQAVVRLWIAVSMADKMRVTSLMKRYRKVFGRAVSRADARAWWVMCGVLASIHFRAQIANDSVDAEFACNATSVELARRRGLIQRHGRENPAVPYHSENVGPWNTPVST